MADGTCKKCGKKLRSDNRSGYCAKCRSYDKLTPYGKQANCDRSRKNSAEFRLKINAIKVERGCAECGYNRYPEALDFDHLPGEDKTKAIALMWGCSWEKVLAEIAKCEIVCSNCHRHRTKVRTDAARAARAAAPDARSLAPRKLAPATCGTESGYNRHRRRGELPCAECIDGAKAARANRYLAQKSAKQQVAA